MRVHFSIIFLILVVTAAAQSWVWAKFPSTIGKEHVQSVGGCDQDQAAYFISRITYGNYQIKWRLVKIDELGNEAWSKEIGGACVADPSGGVFAAGGSYLFKFDGSGNQVWTSVIDSTIIANITLVKGKGVVVNGTFISAGDNRFSILAFFELLGHRKWMLKAPQARLTWPMTTDEHHIYLYGGDSATFGVNRGKVFIYNLDGQLEKEFTVPHHPTAIRVDEDGSIYLTGFHSVYPVELGGITYQGSGKFLVKYDADGNQKWYKYFAGSTDNLAVAIQSRQLFVSFSYAGEVVSEGLVLNGPPRSSQLVVLNYSTDGDLGTQLHTVAQIDADGDGGSIYRSQMAVAGDGGMYLFATITDQGQCFGSTCLECKDYGDLIVAKMQFDNVTSVVEESSVGRIEAFPNPSSNEVEVRCEDLKGALKYRLYDTSGKCVITNSQSQNAFTISLEDLPSGIYLLKVSDSTNSLSHKLVKQ